MPTASVVPAVGRSPRRRGRAQRLSQTKAHAERVELRNRLGVFEPYSVDQIDTIEAHADRILDELEYFHHLSVELFGCDVMISRTGYSGERGYEIFASARDVGTVWDAILGAGAEAGVMPASYGALDKVRVEAALLFYGYDMTDQHHPGEVGLGWTLSRNGADYRGRSEALDAIGRERFVGAGIVVDHDEALDGGETLQQDGVDVGVVNSPAYSHRLRKSLALVHVAAQASATGTGLIVVGDGVTYSAQVESIPFFDPDKTRVRA